MGNETITDRTRALAERSANCVVCQCARRQQAGLAFWVVKTFEGLCPFCRAYAKVYGRKSHEPLPATVAAGILPAVEGGILPPGPAPKSSGAAALRTLSPPGWKPGCTAGKMPAATPEPGPHAATAHSPQQVVEPNPSTKL